MTDIRISDTRIIALCLAIAAGLIYTRSFENEFFKDIVLVSIPSIIGLFGSKYLTKRWQIQKIKIERKKETITSFRKSFKHKFILLDTFAFKIIDHYNTNRNRERLSDSGEIDYQFSSFPVNSEEHPSSLFGNEFDNINNEIEKLRFDASECISLLRLYYKNDKLDRDYQDIGHRLKNLELIVEELINSNDVEQLKNAVRSYNSESKILKTEVKELENNLVNMPLIEPKF